jgi:hypothetical protein
MPYKWPVPALLQASLMLRLALDAAPHNFQLMLSLMHCLEALGAGSMALELYKRCDIKPTFPDPLLFSVSVLRSSTLWWWVAASPVQELH